MSKVDKIALVISVILLTGVMIVPVSRDYVWELTRWVVGLVILGFMVIFNMVFG